MAPADFGADAVMSELAETPAPAAEPAVEAPAAPVEAPAPAPAPVEAPEAPAAEAPKTYPWDKQVAESFTDSTVAEQVATFMKDNYQPYITKLEQERADLAERAQWFDDLNESPDDTLRDALVQLYGEDTAERVMAVLTPEEIADEAARIAAPPAPAADETADQQWLREFREEQELAQATAEYTAAFEAIKEAHPDIVDSAFHRYVATTAAGDIAKALDQYRADFPAPAGEPAPPKPGAPPSLGGSAAAPTPTTPNLRSLHDATAAVYESMFQG